MIVEYQLELIIALGGIALALFVYLLRARKNQAKLAKDLFQAEQRHLHSQHQQEIELQGLRSNIDILQQQLEQSSQSQEKLQAEHQQLLEAEKMASRELAIASEQLQRMQKLELELEQKNKLVSELQQTQAELSERIEQQRLRNQEQLALLADTKANVTKEFEALANKIFENKQQQFDKHSQATLNITLEPLRSQIKDFKAKVEDVYIKENAERNKLFGQITELQKQTQQIGQDAVNLASALKGDNKTQGNWGEVILERLLEESGLQKGREYETQKSLTDESGKRKNPDIIIRMPEKKDLIIDSKVSLLAYERYCNTEVEEERQQALKQHVLSLRTHVTNLSLKDYEKLEGIHSLDFVFVFVPVEAAFMLALQHEPGLFKEAYNKHIILVSPTTLLATLRTVENLWRYEKQNQNAEIIGVQAGAIYDQLVRVVESLDDVGRLIDKTHQAYYATRKRLTDGKGNLVRRVEGIRKLGAKTKKNLPSELLLEAGLDEEETIQESKP